MPLEIASLRLQSPVILAPMSGITDLPFRRLVRGFGVGLTVTEMIASRAMVRAARKTLGRAAGGAGERPLAVQIAGNDPQAMADTARLCRDRGADIIDINMGCPVKKVIKGEAGAALMRDQGLAEKIMEAVVAAVDIPVTVKMRAGWDKDTINAPVLARAAEARGIAAVTVHGRTRAQFYGGRADWRVISEVKGTVAIPVIGNGDITTVDDAARMIAETGVDGVMIGRGACGRPWFPGQAGHFLETGKRLPDPPLSVQLATLLDHYRGMLDHYGVEAGLRVARKHLGWYSKGLPGSAAFRARVNRIADPGETMAAVRAFYEPLIERRAA